MADSQRGCNRPGTRRLDEPVRTCWCRRRAHPRPASEPIRLMASKSSWDDHVILHLNRSSSKPPYLQVTDQIKAAVAGGMIRPGDVLPSIRPLASRLRVNRNTIAKAYRELSHQGVIEATAGRRCVVRSYKSPSRHTDRLILLRAAIDEVIVQALHARLHRGQFLTLIRTRIKAFHW
jgi:GntR family transcriptional regulator